MFDTYPTFDSSPALQRWDHQAKTIQPALAGARETRFARHGRWPDVILSLWETITVRGEATAPPIDITPAAAIPLPKNCLRVTGCFVMTSGTFFYSPFTIYDSPVGRDDTAKREDHECEASEPGAVAMESSPKLRVDWVTIYQQVVDQWKIHTAGRLAKTTESVAAKSRRKHRTV